jgi:hypothetical protein
LKSDSALRFSIEGRVECPVSAGWSKNAISTVPCKKAKFKILNRGGSGNVMVGLIAAQQFSASLQLYTTVGHWLYICNGNLYPGGQSYATGVNNGSTIAVIHDTKADIIRFVIDGMDKGVAFRNVPKHDLFAAVTFSDANVSIELVP